MEQHTNNSAPQCRFERSHLYQMLQKDPSQRTENDLRELRRIILQIEFIRNSEYKFETSDLAEMIKYAKIWKYEPFQKVFKEG